MSFILAIIPARGGSKGIPRKNLAPLGGQPLIAHTLDFCKKLDRLGDVLLSTDDEEIAQFCKSRGLDTPYRRPPNLATDRAGVVDAVLHAVQWYESEMKKIVDHVLLLQPTSPFREAAKLTEALNEYSARELESMVGVTPMREHPFECIEFNKADGSWEYLKTPPRGLVLRQDYPGSFGFIDGSFYLASTKFLGHHNSFVVAKETAPFFMPQSLGIDIDAPQDLKLAESLLQQGA